MLGLYRKGRERGGELGFT